MSDADFNIDALFSYVNNNKKYCDKLEAAITTGLWEYAAILTWKTVIMFIYEKLFQIKSLGIILHENFTRQLEHNNVTCNSCFDFCCIPDESIHTNINRIWANLEVNYAHIFKHLLDERNGLSHVNRYEEEYNKQWYKTFFDRTLTLLEYFDGLHHTQLSARIHAYIGRNELLQYISEIQANKLLADGADTKLIILNYLLDKEIYVIFSEDWKNTIRNEVISNFVSSASFRTAEENGRRLIKIAEYLDSADVRRILSEIYTQQTGTNNQILLAGEMPAILAEFFDKTINVGDLRVEWQSFVNSIDIAAYALLINKINETFQNN